MPYPFFFLAVSLAAGILGASLFVPSPSVPIAGMSAALAAAWVFYARKKDKVAFGLALLATAFLGSGLLPARDASYENNPLIAADFSGYADFTGTLYQSPSRGQDRFYLYLSVETVRFQDRQWKLAGNIRISVLNSDPAKEIPKLFTGDRVKVSAQLLPRIEYRNFSKSPYEEYLKSQNIHRRAFTKSSLLVEKIPAKSASLLLRPFSALRHTLQDKLERSFPGPAGAVISNEGAVLEAMLLGERGRMDQSVNLALQKSGLYHLIAISGGHIAIISFLLFSVLRLLRVPRRASYGILIALLVFYALLVEGKASVFRATIMTLIFLTGKLIWRDTNLLNAISISAFFLLLFNPFNLFDMGFVLTFASTLAIILFFDRVMRRLPRVPLKISEMLAMSITAQLGVIPFIARSFNWVTFASLLLNFAAIPLIGMIMAAGYVFLILGFLSPSAAGLLARGLKILTGLFLDSTHLLDGVPASSYRIPAPHALTVVGYFLFLLLFLAPLKKPAWKWGRLAGFVLFFTIIVTYPFAPARPAGLRVTFIDAGQGESILVEFPGRAKMLVDGGGTQDGAFDIGETVVSPVLWRKGIRKIDILVLTHAHPDHMNGLKAVVRNFRINEFWEAPSQDADPSYQELRQGLGRNVVRRQVGRGFSREINGVLVEVFHPAETMPPAAGISNDQSLVLRLSKGGDSLLLAGDIGVAAEREIIAGGGCLQSRILKSPHHGSRTSSSKEFIAAISPEIVVICAGRNNVYGAPHQDIVDRYEKAGARVLRTDLDGAVEITFRKQSYSLRLGSERR